jgi:transcriptional regulator with GAF, ATPase, and Fis domain
MSALPSVVLPEAGVLVASSSSLLRQRFVENFDAQAAIEQAMGGADALHKLETGKWQLLVLDRRLPDLDAEELVSIVRRRFPTVHVMLLEAGESWTFEDADEETARGSGKIQPSPVSAFRAGGRDSNRTAPLPGMVGESEAMRGVYRNARLVAPRTTTVLITGPTGTGKELVARGIHKLSARSARPFVAVNCAAIPEALLESELFGHVRGAFTGAVQSQVGRACAAQGGTLFLDEVGELPLSLQPKLLRFLEQKEVQRLGSPEPSRVDVRVIAATNVDLTQRVLQKQFREDLYYRLATFSLELPPLSDRAGDILILAKHLLSTFGDGEHAPQLSAEAMRLLQRHSWRGNVRELQLVLERACILTDGGPTIFAEHIQFPCLQTANNNRPDAAPYSLERFGVKGLS